MHMRRRAIRALAMGGALTLILTGLAVSGALPAAATPQAALTPSGTYNMQDSTRFTSRVINSPDGAYQARARAASTTASGGT